MTTESFCFWLQGYFELGGDNLSPQQVQIIKDHLALVFNKVTPKYDLGTTTTPQDQTYCGKSFPTWSGNPPIETYSGKVYSLNGGGITFDKQQALDSYNLTGDSFLINYNPPFDANQKYITC